MATAYYRPRRNTERAATTTGHGSQATRPQDMQATDGHGCTRIKLSHAETRRARRRQLNEAAALPLRRAARRAAGGRTIRRYKRRWGRCVACICGSCDLHAAGTAGCPAERAASPLPLRPLFLCGLCVKIVFSAVSGHESHERTLIIPCASVESVADVSASSVAR